MQAVGAGTVHPRIPRGFLPGRMALATGAGAEMRHAMGIAVLGGIAPATRPGQ